jgi:riboflavin synthase
MFTGLVERTGVVKQVTGESSGLFTLVVDPGPDFERDHGASVAVNGVCLSEVGHQQQGDLTFHVSHETLSKTSLQNAKPGMRVNLERSMRPTDRLGGHIVLGHVDGTGTITTIRKEESFYFVEILIPKTLSPYVVSKGSIAIDGTSLTINALRDDDSGTHLSFMLIPVTWDTTRFADVQINDKVNIEVDMIAKHLERLSLPWKTTNSKL